jgi:hypothetical protein
MTSTEPLESATAVLGFARTRRADAEAAEVDVLRAAVQWAVMHPVDSILEAAVVPGTEGELAIAGPGAPLVAEFCVAEFAAALGMTTDAGRRFLGHAVELRYRLPKHYARVMAGEVPVWKARRVAERTLCLSPEAAAWVDAKLAPFAHSIGPIQLDRTIDAALARFMPEEAERRRVERAEQRRFDLDFDHARLDGTVAVDGVLDAADALDLEAAVSATARQLADLGCTESLNVRRSKAVGEIARRDATLFSSVEPPSSVEPVETTTRMRTDRDVVLYVHLTDTALAGLNPVGRCANTRSPVLTEQIRGWCGTSGRITVKPVLDLAGHDPVEAYERPGRHDEQVELRRRSLRLPPLPTTGQEVRQGPCGPVAGRADLSVQPRTAVPTAPPPQDPRRLDLHLSRARNLCVAQPVRVPLPRRPPRHHRCHRRRRFRDGCRATSSTTETRRVAATPRTPPPGGATGMPGGRHRGQFASSLPRVRSGCGR